MNLEKTYFIGLWFSKAFCFKLKWFKISGFSLAQITFSKVILLAVSILNAFLDGALCSIQPNVNPFNNILYLDWIFLNANFKPCEHIKFVCCDLFIVHSLVSLDEFCLDYHFVSFCLFICLFE